MKESDYYPAGAYNDTKAPYNQSDLEEKEFEVTCSQSLSKTLDIFTNNYIPGASGVDYEYDDEGYCAVPWHDPDDTSDTNWAEEYHANDHYTPLQLINLFKNLLQLNIDNGTPLKSKKYSEHLIEECSGWIEDDIEYIND